MSTMETSRRRFRIEPLEERIAPACLFWADDLSARMTAEWATNTATDPQEFARAEITNRFALRQPSALDARMRADALSHDGLEFPAWAEELLKQVDTRLASNTTPDTILANQAKQSARLGELMNLVHPSETEHGHFPAWAEELLAHVDRRLDDNTKAQLQKENYADKSHRLDEILDAICQPEPFTANFPEWAEEMLEEVDRRLEMTASMTPQQLARLDNVMSTVCSSDDGSHFPSWAENLLEEVDRRLEAASGESASVSGKTSSMRLDEVMSMIRRPRQQSYAGVR